jgi:hypothetical protein
MLQTITEIGDGFRKTFVVPAPIQAFEGASAGTQWRSSSKTLDSRPAFAGTKGRGNDDIKDRGVAHFRSAQASRTLVMLKRRAFARLNNPDSIAR